VAERCKERGSVEYFLATKFLEKNTAKVGNVLSFDDTRFSLSVSLDCKRDSLRIIADLRKDIIECWAVVVENISDKEKSARFKDRKRIINVLTLDGFEEMCKKSEE
jgi:hypothetical protein